MKGVFECVKGFMIKGTPNEKSFLNEYVVFIRGFHGKISVSQELIIFLQQDCKATKTHKIEKSNQRTNYVDPFSVLNFC
jgi:hypothetical protein